MAKKIKKQKTVVNKEVVQESFQEQTPKTKFLFSKKTVRYVLTAFILVGLIYFGGKVFFVASVNGQLINRLSVIKELEKQGGKATLDTIVLKTVISQEAKKRKIDISQKEMDTELAKIEKNVTSQGTTLDSLLAQQGMTKSDLTNEIKLQLLVTKMVDSNITIADKEIDDYLASQKEQSALTLGEAAPAEITKDQAKEAIKQQKLQGKIQTFVSDLKAKAKINYFVKY